jgi:glycosyltransferase involved in cell wall biosynthesis
MSISAIILTKNNEDLITDCLESVGFCNEIIVVDGGSTDDTLKIAKRYKAKIVEGKGGFSERRNLGAEKASNDWLFYIDSDERATPLLRREIEEAVRGEEHPAYAMPRKNILLGHEMKHGGWWPDYVLRLIKRDKLEKWEGKLHEQPIIKGEIGKLENPLTHITHRSLSEMVDKTNDWSEIEAQLLFESNHPPMTWWRFMSAAFREFWYRGVKKVGFLDGVPGVIEIIYQMFSRMITYAKLWEMQIKREK